MSVSWGTQYAKLKTNLRLAANRLKLLQKKKTEQALKARTEIAEFISNNKEDRARIRVESIIREDFVVEAYELLEMYCELLLARFGIIQQMKEVDDGIAEAVSSLLWVAPRIGHEVNEFKVINDQLQQKYGKQYAEAARMNQLPEPSRVSPKLIQKLSVSAPSKILVEKYLIEIAKSAGIPFTPDEKVLRDDDDEIAAAERNLINFMKEEQIGWSVQQQQNKNDGPGGPPGGPPYNPGPDGGMGGGGGGGGGSRVPFAYPPPQHAAPKPPVTAPPNMYPSTTLPPPPQYAAPTPKDAQQPMDPMDDYLDYVAPKNPMPGSASAPNDTEHIYEVPPGEDDLMFPEPPSSHFPEPPKGFGVVPRPPPSDSNTAGGKPDDLNFDDLSKRFDQLKKRL
jgi:vacuolar protein sorting-associated protein IST1